MRADVKEKVRDAIFEAIGSTAKDSDGLALQGGRIFFDGSFDGWVVARAAITALLGVLEEPSRAMWAASGDAVVKLQDRNIGHHDAYSEAVWKAMLSAFREEGVDLG